MEVYFVNKETGEKIEYQNVQWFDNHGASDDGPVFQIGFEGDSTATFHKKDWLCYVRAWREYI